MSFLTNFHEARRRPIRRALRQQSTRRLLLEGLENRQLMAFNVVAEYATGAGPTDIAVARINAGGQLDLVIADNTASQGSVRLGNGNGTFGAAQSTGVAASSVVTGDFSSDGITDLVSIEANVIVQRGNGNGTFQTSQSILLPPQVAPGNPDPTPLTQRLHSIATGDLNADGKLDLVISGQTEFQEYTRYYQCGYYGCGYVGFWSTHLNGYVNVLIGNGNGGFSAPVVYPMGSYRSAGGAAIGDLNNDGNADVLVANNYGLNALLGNGDGTLAAPVQSGYNTSLKSAFLGDFDSDGNLDALTGDGITLYIQKGQGNGTFIPLTQIVFPNRIDSVVVGDVSGDGLLDIAVAGTAITCLIPGYYSCYSAEYRGQASVVLGNGDGSFSLPIPSSLGTEMNAAFVDLSLADLTSDHQLDLVVIEKITGKVIVAANDGDWFPPIALEISDVTVVEGHSGTTNAVFSISLATASSRPVTVQYSTADLTADESSWWGPTATMGVDYTHSAGTLTIPAGQTSAMINVPVHGDRIGESDELFIVNLSNPTNAILTNSRVFGTIIDDEPYISFEYYTSPEVVEGDSGTQPMTIIVELTAPSDISVTADFATADVSAIAGSDYIAQTETVTFPPGTVRQTIAVQIIGDTHAEWDETLLVSLSNPTNAKIGTGYKYGYIIDNDSIPAINISDASDYEGNHGNKLLTFSVTLSQVSSNTVRVNYATVNGTASTNDNDYIAKSGTLYFAPGEYSKTISVVIKGDKKRERDEYFYVRLFSSVNSTIETNRATGTIWNDDNRFYGSSQLTFASAVDLALEELNPERLKKRRR